MRTPAAVVNKGFEGGECAAVVKARVSKETKGVTGKTHRCLTVSSYHLHVRVAQQGCGLNGWINTSEKKRRANAEGHGNVRDKV